MMRRQLLLGGAAATLLSACGFQLRQAPNFAFGSIFVNAADSSPLGGELKRTLGASGKLDVVADVAQLQRAQVVLHLLLEQREKVVVGLGATGQVREFQLRLRVRFRLRTRDGQDLIGDTELLQTRDISFNESGALSKEAEENLLYREMQTDIVQQLIRRLAAVKSLQGA